MLETGILPFSHAEKTLWRWESYFRWLRYQAYEAGYRVVKRDTLLPYKSSDTLFVLGSGPSINLINNAEWEDIARHNSIGFNYFLAHSFVPTFYHMELLQKHMPMFRDCYSQRREAYRGVPFMLNLHFIINDYKSDDLDFIENRMVTVPRMYSEANSNDMDKIIRFTGKYIEPFDDYFLLHYRGSLCLMISIGVMLGYKKIILAGVDLNSPSYFYCADHYACEATKELRKDRCQRIEGGLHATADPSFIPSTITIDGVLKLLREATLIPRGIELYVYDRDSLLYPEFPAWRGRE